MSLLLLRHGATAFAARNHSLLRTQGNAITRHFSSFTPIQVSSEISSITTEERMSQQILNARPNTSGVEKGSEELVLEALQQRRDPQLLLRAFLKASEDRSYLQSLPLSTFDRVLELLGPEYHIEPFAELRDDWMWIKDRYPRIEQLVVDYTNVIALLMRRWREAGRQFRLAEYRFMMRIAYEVGSKEMAGRTRYNMRLDKIEMDTTCHNYFFGSRCGPGAFDIAETNHLRVIRYLTQARKYLYRSGGGGVPLAGFRSYTVHGHKSIQTMVSRHFFEMVEKGLAPDVNSFRLLLLAQGRGGQIISVKSILRKVWDVDLDAISFESEGAFTTHLPPDSPIYPTPLLLETVAHVFGCNNDLSTAIRAVDYMSRKFSVEITNRAWSELLKWAYVLSRGRREKRGTRKYTKTVRGGWKRGQLPVKASIELWDAMVSPPYSIQPTLRMYRYRMKRLAEKGMFSQMLEALREVCRLAAKPPSIAEDLWTGNALVIDEGSLPSSTHSSHPLISQSHHQAELRSLEYHRNRQMISTWFQKLARLEKYVDPRLTTKGSEIVKEFFDYSHKGTFLLSVMTGKICIFRQEVSMVSLSPSRDRNLMIISATGHPKGSHYEAKTLDFIDMQGEEEEDAYDEGASLIREEPHDYPC
ncbi:MAG: hypothetical protein MMC33_002883 [Icmadophila ericetorum]|nr:hypothetical protein [Icmadophila ericetorum]